MWEASEYVFKHMWENGCGKNIEILDKNRKQKHVISICTISVLAPDFLTSPGWLCVPAKSIHLSLPQCAKAAERKKTETHARRSCAKWRVSDSGRKNAQKRWESYLHQSFLSNCYLFYNFKWLKLSVCRSLSLQILTPGYFHSKC